jgi:hypothetical protein
MGLSPVCFSRCLKGCDNEKLRQKEEISNLPLQSSWRLSPNSSRESGRGVTLARLTILGAPPDAWRFRAHR